MMKYGRYIILFCAIILLILIDQGTKIAVGSLYVPTVTEEQIMQEQGFHIHLVVNNKTQMKIENLAKKTALPVGLWRAIDVFFSILVAAVVFFGILLLYKSTKIAEIKTYGPLVFVLLCLIGAGSICGLCDNIIWCGTRDFLCFSWVYKSSSGTPRIMHMTSDVKDQYLRFAILLAIVYLVLIGIGFYRFSKDRDSFAKFKESWKNALKGHF